MYGILLYIKKNFKKLVFSAGLTALIAINGYIFSATASENDVYEIEQQPDARIIKTYFFNITCKADTDLKGINKKLRIDFPTELPKPKEDGLEEEIGHKFDSLCMRVEEILDVYPKDLKVNVVIFRNKEELDSTYRDIYKEKKIYAAFYSHKFNTIYLCQQYISQHIIAHEVAHSVVDSHFGSPPPRTIAEILARHVDKNLEK